MKNLILVLVLMFNIFLANAQWNWTYPSPFGWSFRGVYFLNPQHGFVCGETGKLFKTTNAGETWQEITTGLDAHLKSVYFIDLNTGFLITSEGDLLRTNTGGLSWVLIDLSDAVIEDIQFVTDQIGFVCGEGGVLLMTTDVGLTWTQATLDPMYDSWDINALHFVDELSGYAVGDVAIKHKTIDGGLTWTTSWVDPMVTLNDVYFINATTGYASGEDYLMLFTQNGGISWDAYMSSHTVTQMYFVNATTGFALSDEGALVKTTDNGHNWAELALQGCTAYCFAGDQTVHAVGPYGVLLKSTNSGSTCTSYTTHLTSDHLIDIRFCNPDVGFAVGFSPQTLSDAHIFKTIDAGAHWEQVSTIPLFYPTNLFFTSPLVGYVSFCNGELTKTTDGGLTWEQLETNITACISGITFTNPSTGYLIIEEPPCSILKTEDAGASWQTIYQSGSFEALRGIHFVNENVGFVVTSGSCLRTLDAGLSWTDHPISDTSIFMDVFFPNEQLGYIAGFSGEVYKTLDGGETWYYLPLPDYSTISKLFFTDENTGYALGNSGDFYQTNNGGVTWIKLNYMPKSWFNSIWFTSDLAGYICGGNGLIMKTDNGGAVWINSNAKKPSSTTIWPNPAKDELNISCNTHQPLKVKLYNAVGVLVKELELSTGNEKINISELGVGLYVVQVLFEEGLCDFAKVVKN